jgi:hypothetical protein
MAMPPIAALVQALLPICRDACACAGADRRAAHRSLLLRGHVRAAEDRAAAAARISREFSCVSELALQSGNDHLEPDRPMTGRCSLPGFLAYQRRARPHAVGVSPRRPWPSAGGCRASLAGVCPLAISLDQVGDADEIAFSSAPSTSSRVPDQRNVGRARSASTASAMHAAIAAPQPSLIAMIFSMISIIEPATGLPRGARAVMDVADVAVPLPSELPVEIAARRSTTHC